MKLVGATDWFIRWPFMIEGIVLGALGGVLAILLLVVGKIALIDPLAQDFALIAAPETINFALLVGVLLAASVRRLRRRARGCRCAASCASDATAGRLSGADEPPTLRAIMRRLHRPRPLTLALSRARAGPARRRHLARRASRAPARVRPRHRSSTSRTHGRRTRRSTRSRTTTTARCPRASSPTPRSRAWSRRSTTASPTTSRPRSTSASRRSPRAEFSGVGLSVVERRRGPARSRGSTTARRPARRALKHGDVIVAVDGKSLKGVPEETASR